MIAFLAMTCAPLAIISAKPVTILASTCPVVLSRIEQARGTIGVGSNPYAVAFHLYYARESLHYTAAITVFRFADGTIQTNSTNVDFEGKHEQVYTGVYGVAQHGMIIDGWVSSSVDDNGNTKHCGHDTRMKKGAKTPLLGWDTLETNDTLVNAMFRSLETPKTLRTIEERQQAKLPHRQRDVSTPCTSPNADAAITGAPAQPVYPNSARELGATGVSQIKVTLDSHGTVTDASVYKSAGNPDLDKAAVLAATETKYTPEIVNCHGAAGSYVFRAEFTGQ